MFLVTSMIGLASPASAGFVGALMQGAHHYPAPGTILGGEAEAVIEPGGTTLDNAFGTGGSEGYYVAHVTDARVDIEFVRLAGSWSAATFNGFILQEIGDVAPPIVSVELVDVVNMNGLTQSDVVWGEDFIRLNIADIVTDLESSCSLLVTFAPACDGDVNGDGEVNFTDLNLVLDNWSGVGPEGDANGDGAVDFTDLNAVLDEWGAGC